MKTAEWNEKFGEGNIITLTDKERRYFALSPLSPDWECLCFYSKTNLWYTRVTVYFQGDVIVKVISETNKVLDGNNICYKEYTEYDTNLATDCRNFLLPLTTKGKPKPISASNINSVTPFGCRFTIAFETGKETAMRLVNPRANREFPIGEWEKVSVIGNEEDFHEFMREYIDSCREDYFQKLYNFKSAKKVTVKYKTGDIFCMELDRNRCCYGIITGEIRRIKKIDGFPEKHSFNHLMTVPIMVRFYQLITEKNGLKADDLKNIPLGRVRICSDNDIIWGTHRIVDHKELEPEDLEFNFVCTKVISESPHTTLFTQDMLLHDKIIPKQKYNLYIEWGFSQTVLKYEQLTPKLKEYLEDYYSPHGGVSLSIDPRDAVLDEKYRQYYTYKNNLLNAENRDMLNEIFICLGLDKDITFDKFAERFGGLSLKDILLKIKK